MKNRILLATVFLTSVTYGQLSNDASQSAKVITGDKVTWIKNNPEAYQKMGGTLEPVELEKNDIPIQQVNDAANQLSSLVERPDFPSYQNTGNKLEDDRRFELAKSEWRSKIIAINESTGVYMQSGEEKEKWVRDNPTLYNME